MERSYSLSKLFSVALAAVLAMTVAVAFSAPASAYAQDITAAPADSISSSVSEQALTSGATTKTVKKSSFTTTTKQIKKVATRVYTGTTKLKVAKGQGYIKFTAPKTKKYSFTFSNLTGAKRAVYSAFVEVQLQSSYSAKNSFMTKVATKGGKTTTLWLAQKGYASKSGKLVSRNLVSRTGTIKLAKGQDIYFYFFNGSNNTNVTMKVA